MSARILTLFASCGRMSAVAAVALLLVASTGRVIAATNVAPASVTMPPAELSAQGSAALEAIQLLFAQSDWDAMAVACDELIARSSPGSYDSAVAHLHRAQAQIARGERDARAYGLATASLEHVIASGFWPTERMHEWQLQLGRLYLFKHRFDDAERVLENWIATSPAPTPEGYALLVSGTLTQAQETSGPVDTSRLERALARVNAGLRLGARPDESLLYLKAACLQTLQRWEEAAEVLEFILHGNPAQPVRWEQLYGLYATAGRDLPAVLTIERARRYGALESSRADVAMGQHFYNLGQSRPALDAWETALHRGIEHPASHGIFAAYLAYQTQDLERSARLLDTVRPFITEPAQLREAEALRAALAVSDSAE